MIDVRHGDCLDVMARLDPVDAIVTDPPYALSFMGRGWDAVHPPPQTWEVALALLPPGGYLVAFGGTRTHHRLWCAIEDAGFEIRDTLSWMYGSGFPKSRALLKPAFEPICLARKPGPLRHLAIDACRVGDEQTVTLRNGNSGGKSAFGRDERVFERANPPGRWPANVCHDGSAEVLEAFARFGEGHARGNVTAKTHKAKIDGVTSILRGSDSIERGWPGDAGSAARFFFSAPFGGDDLRFHFSGKADEDDRMGTSHPTTKPIALMRWLCRLVCPPGGTILDPFGGSGSTAVASIREGFNCVIVEREAEYVEMIRKRLAHLRGDDTPLFSGVVIQEVG